MSVTSMDNAEKIMTQKVITCAPTDTFQKIQQVMADNGINRVVVADKDQPEGIITQKDIIKFLVADKSARGLEEIKAQEGMATKPRF